MFGNKKNMLRCSGHFSLHTNPTNMSKDVARYSLEQRGTRSKTHYHSAGPSGSIRHPLLFYVRRSISFLLSLFSFFMFPQSVSVLLFCVPLPKGVQRVILIYLPDMANSHLLRHKVFFYVLAVCLTHCLSNWKSRSPVDFIFVCCKKIISAWAVEF